MSLDSLFEKEEQEAITAEVKEAEERYIRENTYSTQKRHFSSISNK